MAGCGFAMALPATKMASNNFQSGNRRPAAFRTRKQQAGPAPWRSRGHLGAAFLAIAILLVGANHAKSEGETPRRVVSINLCADQYLAVLAERGQIVGLSPLAHDPSISFFAERLKGLPAIRDDAESVLMLQPDLVIASVYNKPQTLRLLRAQGLNIFVLPAVRKLEDIAEHIVRLAGVLGRDGEGAALAANLHQVMARTKNAATASAFRKVLYYQRGGYASGRGSYIGMMLHHLGLINIAGQRGQVISSLPLESVVAHPPDLLIVSDQVHRSDNQGATLLNHPALARILKRKSRLIIPMRETICPGPVLNAALSDMAAQIRSLADGHAKATSRGREQKTQ